jgi:serine/threonine-protein kinase RsbW
MSDPHLIEVLRIPSSLERLSDVDAAVESIARGMGFGESACADLGICVTEAAGNAILHAHHQREELPVEIRFEKLAGALRVIVRDHGEGFEVQEISDPTLPENLLKLNGRGLHLIRALMDQTEIQRLPDGMQIIMIKNLGHDV